MGTCLVCAAFRRGSRFDIVMDDHLLGEVFTRFDPEGSGKVSSALGNPSNYICRRMNCSRCIVGTPTFGEIVSGSSRQEYLR